MTLKGKNLSYWMTISLVLLFLSNVAFADETKKMGKVLGIADVVVPV